MSNNAINLQDFSHFAQMPLNGWFILWSVDNCEKCDGECEAPNSINVKSNGLTKAFCDAGLTARPLTDTLGELGYSDEFGGAVCPGCYSEEKEAAELKYKPYVWTVQIEIDPKWVADGFDLDEDRLRDMLQNTLSCATSCEVGGKVLTAPDPKQIRAEQGCTVDGYKPRNPDL